MPSRFTALVSVWLPCNPALLPSVLPRRSGYVEVFTTASYDVHPPAAERLESNRIILTRVPPI